MSHQFSHSVRELDQSSGERVQHPRADIVVQQILQRVVESVEVQREDLTGISLQFGERQRCLLYTSDAADE